MTYQRLDNLVKQLEAPTGVIDFNEYRKAQLIVYLLRVTHGGVSARNFELFMDKADLLETSIYERLKLQATRCGWGCSEARLRSEAFKQIQECLSNLPIFSAL